MKNDSLSKVYPLFELKIFRIEVNHSNSLVTSPFFSLLPTRNTKDKLEKLLPTYGIDSFEFCASFVYTCICDIEISIENKL